MNQKNYQKLHELSRHAKILGGIASLLEWDQETYMPAAGAANRAEQVKTLAGIVHKERTGKKYGSALSKLIDLKTGETAPDLTEEQRAALKEWRRDFIRDTALPNKFVKDFAKLSSQAQLVWREARKENAYQRFAPFLDKLITMNRKMADYLGYQEHPYDALLDHYEPEATAKDVGALFGDLKTHISTLIKKIAATKQIDDHFLNGQFEQEKQLKLGRLLLEKMGYDMERGRLDISSHPFSSASHPTDSRVTTRIHPSSVISNISVVLHEGGHGMYEMGLPVEHYGSPLGEAASLGVHESQSRWWETRIGQSRGFWQHFLPIVQAEFPQLAKLTLDEVYRAVNKVEPTFIRVEADEVTYPLHVVLRFEIEKALVEGSLKVRDVPAAWNQKMEELLGIRPPTNTEGCLQDIHWSMGAMGYFPTYTLGNMYASQLFETFAKQHPDWEKKVASGDFAFIKDWLSKNIYQHGRRFRPKELIQKVTGKPFNAHSYIDYLNKKYREIYLLKE